MSEWTIVGTHRVCVEGDIAWFSFGPTLLRSEVADLFQPLSSRIERGQQMLMLCEISKVGFPPPETRRWFGEWSPSHYVALCACYGGSPSIIALAQLLIRGVAMVIPRPNKIGFHRDEATARSWLAREQAKLTVP